MNNYEVVVKWIGEDVQGLYPEWSLFQCEWALEEVQRHLRDNVIELGNELLERLLESEVDISDCPEED